jgi:hypothetical protein
MLYPRNDPLQNHIATVKDYLLRYKKIDASKRLKFQLHFAIYLMAYCREKLYRWITHWSSQGFIHELAQPQEGSLQEAFTSYAHNITPTTRCDSTLGSLLIGMAEQGEISKFILGKCGRPELASDF